MNNIEKRLLKNQADIILSLQYLLVESNFEGDVLGKLQSDYIDTYSLIKGGTNE